MLDYEPRKLTAQDCTVLCNLAGMVIKQIQGDQQLRERENSGQVLQRRNSRLNVNSLYLHVHPVFWFHTVMLSGSLRSSMPVTVLLLVESLSQCIRRCSIVVHV